MADFGFEGGYIIVPRFGPHDPANNNDIGNWWVNTFSGSWTDPQAWNSSPVGIYNPIDGTFTSGVPGAQDNVSIGAPPDGSEQARQSPSYTDQAGNTSSGYVAGVDSFPEGYRTSGGFHVSGASGTVANLGLGGEGTIDLAGLTVTQGTTIVTGGGINDILFYDSGPPNYGGFYESGYNGTTITVQGSVLTTPVVLLTVSTNLTPYSFNQDPNPPDPVADAGAIIINGATINGDFTRITPDYGATTISTDAIQAETVKLNAGSLNAKTQLDINGFDTAFYPNATGTGGLVATGAKITAGSVVIATGDAGEGSASSTTAVLTLQAASSLVITAATGADGSLIVGDSGMGTLNVTGASTISDQQAIIGNQLHSTGTATLDGGSWTNTGYLSVGNNGVGTLTVQNGGTLANKGANGNAFIGGLAGSNGSLATVTGKGSTWTTDGYFVVGSGDNGSLLVDQGGLLTTSNILQAGLIGGVTGVITVSNGATLTTDSAGGEATISTELGVAAGGVGELTIDGPGTTAESKAAVSIGYDGVGTATASNGGSFVVDSSIIRIARNAGSYGSLYVTDAGSNLTATNATLYDGYGGLATATIRQGGTLTVKATDLGGEATGDGTLIIDGTDTQATLGDTTIGNMGIGEIDVTGGASPNVADLVVGMADGAEGTLSVSGSNSSLTATGTLTVAAEGGSTGSIEVSGSNANVTINGDATVGDAGDGHLDLHDAGGMDVLGNLTEGAEATGSGLDSIAGKNTSLHAHGTWTLAESGQHETDITTGGAATVDGQFTIGAQAGSDGTLMLTDQDTMLTAGGGVTIGEFGMATVKIGPGATLDASTSDVSVAENAGSSATIDLTGDTGTGTSTAGLSGELDAQSLTIAGAGSATLDAEGGSTVTVLADMTIGETDGGTGHVIIDGDGTGLTVGGDLTIGGAGVGTLDIGGQNSSVSVSGVTIIAESGSGTLAVQGGEFDSTGMLTIGSAGNGICLVQLGGSLQASGGVTLGEAAGGVGELDVRGGNASVTGDLVVGSLGQGTLKIDQSGSVQVNGTVTLGDKTAGIVQTLSLDTGGTLFVTGELAVGGSGIGGAQVLAGSRLVVAGAATIGDVAGSGGTLTVDGSSVLTYGTLTVGNDGTGGLTISGGALAGGPSGGAAPATLTIAAGAHSHGSVTVTGTGSTLKADVLDIGSAAGGSGTLEIAQGGTVIAADVTVYAGGVLSIDHAALLTDPLTLNSGATVDATGTVGGNIMGSGTVFITAGGSLSLTGAVTAGVIVDLSTAGQETLSLSLPGSFAGTIADFIAGDTLVLGSYTSVISTFINGELVVSSNGQQIADLHFAGGYADGAVSAIVSGGMVEVVTSVACFAQGTSIATPAGPVSVEHLRPGDLVTTLSGPARKLVWVGHRTLACALSAEPTRVWPVRVRAHAFGPHRPVRDLLLSPEHAVFIDNLGHPPCLIPIECLINGDTIRQQPTDRITYWHLELDTHDVLLAEGLPAESYLESGNRQDFETPSRATLFDAGLDRFRAPCAPIRRQGPIVEAVRTALAHVPA